MAFGALRGTLTGNSTNPGTGISATGSVSVTKGDLIVANYATRGTVEVKFTDNLGNGYELVEWDSSIGNARPFVAWAIAKANGTLTSVTASHASSSADVGFPVVVIEGVFDGWCHDVDTATIADSTSPYGCPNSGTLSQADEVIIGLQAQGNGATAANYAATSPYTLGLGASSGTGSNTASGGISFHLVSATTGEAPEITTGTSTSGGTKTLSFRKARTQSAGDCIGTLSGFGNTANIVSSGFATVAVDDVIVVASLSDGNSSVTAFSDNLGNTYTAPTNNTQTISSFQLRFFYSIVTTAGDLTTITATNTAQNLVFSAAAFKGAFTGLDTNPATTTDASDPYACPATGTLSQADELVVGIGAAALGLVQTGNSPDVLAASAIGINHTAGVTGRLVSATTSVAPSFSADPDSAHAVGTLSFTVSAGGPTQHDGAATLAGAGTVSASSRQQVATSASLAGAGTLSTSTIAKLVATAALAGSSSLASSSVKDKQTTARLDGASTLAASSAKDKLADATLAGTGTLSVSSRQQHAAGTTLAGSSSLDASTIKTKTATATLAGSGTLSADTVQAGGAVQHQATATLAGSGTLSVDTRAQVAASATLVGSGALDASTIKSKTATATLVATSSLDASTQKSKLADATFSSLGSISAVGVLNVSATATLSGTGTLSAETRQNLRASALLSGSGSLSADSVLTQATKLIEATLAGTSTLSATPRVRTTGTALLSGDGSLSALLGQGHRASATLQGAGALSADIISRLRASATLAGSGTLSGEGTQAGQQLGTATLAGVATLFADTSKDKQASATLSGSSALSASAIVSIKQIVAAIAGSGILVADARLRLAASAQMSGLGGLSGEVRQQQAVSARLDGVGTFSANVIHFPAVPIITPPSRVLRVDLEDRQIEEDAELRVVQVDFEDRVVRTEKARQ